MYFIHGALCGFYCTRIEMTFSRNRLASEHNQPEISVIYLMSVPSNCTQPK